jgi:transposase InsO family protein
VGLVADLMRELGLRACQPRAYKRTTVPGEQPVTSPDRIGRDFTAAAPGTRLVGDITYLRTGEGWLYLATVIDLATRMVIGWQLAPHLRTSLVTDALQMGIDAGLVAPQSIFHSDKGTQGGFNWPSQHLDREVEQWVLSSDTSVCRHIEDRSDRAVVRLWRGARTGCGFGWRLLAVSRPRSPARKRACRGRSGSAGSATLAA